MTAAPINQQAASPAEQTAPDPLQGLPAEAQKNLRQTGLSEEALAVFLQGLEDDPDEALSQRLGLPAKDAPTDEAPAAEEKGQQQEQPAPAEEAPKLLTTEELNATYGETVVTKAAEANIDLNRWRAAHEAGQDTAPFRQAMATALGLPEELIAQYEQGARAVPQQAQAPQPLGDDGTKAILEFAGGDAEFQQLNQWVLRSIPEDPSVAAFNAAVQAGNLEASKGWLAAIAMMRRLDVGHEPELIQGGASDGSESDVYDSWDAYVAEMNAPDPKTGQRRYDVDKKWKSYLQRKALRSRALD